MCVFREASSKKESRSQRVSIAATLTPHSSSLVSSISSGSIVDLACSRLVLEREGNESREREERGETTKGRRREKEKKIESRVRERVRESV